MNICLITEFFPNQNKPEFSGGVEARTFFLHKYLQKNHKVTVINRTKSNIAVSTNSIFPRLIFIFSAILQAVKVNADIYEGSNFICYPVAFIAAKLKHKPAVAWVPDLYLDTWFKKFSLIPALSGYLLEKLSLILPFDHFIAMSQTTKDKLIQAGISSQKITVIYGGVEIKALQQLKSTKNSKPTIVTLARLVEYKRIQDLINALPLIKTKIPDIQLLVLGEGPYKPTLQHLTKKLNLTKHIMFLGNQPHDQAMKTLKSSHLFSLPSLVEGFGLVTIEAMAAGIPYLNSDIPTTKEITQNGLGGDLFPATDHKVLAQKAIKLLTNKTYYQTKKIQATDFVTRYDWATITQQTQDVYANQINNTNN